MYKVSIIGHGYAQDFDNEFTFEQMQLFVKMCFDEFNATEVKIIKI